MPFVATTTNRKGFAMNALRTGDKVFSPNIAADLTVAQLSYGKVELADVLSGAATPTVAWLSQDGRGFDTSRYHSGPEGESVYVEIHRADGSDFHGFIDADSRLLTQAG